MTITYLKGDATEPRSNGNRVILHVCNDIGKWGRGFVLALSNKWSEPEALYRQASFHLLGHIQIARVDDQTTVVNMIAQKGLRSKENPTPIRYNALQECLERVLLYFHNTPDVSFHMPRIGCGLGGGNWTIVESIINKTLIKKGYKVFVYDFQNKISYLTGAVSRF